MNTFPKPDINDPKAAGEGWSPQGDAWYHSVMLDPEHDEADAIEQSKALHEAAGVEW